MTELELELEKLKKRRDPRPYLVALSRAGRLNELGPDQFVSYLREGLFEGISLESYDVKSIERENLAPLLKDGFFSAGNALHGANLRGAFIQESDLQGADLREMDLREVDLWLTDLRGADLRERISGSGSQGADLRERIFEELTFEELTLEIRFTTPLSSKEPLGTQLHEHLP